MYLALAGSAGSLKSLEAFFDALGTASELCVVVATHRGADHDGLLSQLLASHTDMPVQQVTERTLACAGHVYLIPPEQDMGIEQGHLTLAPSQNVRGQRATIDRFLESLAADQGAKAAAIIFSGTGSDAALGACAIHKAGGLTIAQAPEEAAYPEMPEQAIAAGGIGHILAVEQMPDMLDGADTQAEHVGKETEDGAPTDSEDSEDSEQRDAILSLIKSRHGHDFSHYKRGTIARRIARRMQIAEAVDLQDYLEKIRASHDESESLLSDLRIGVTSFFRDANVFQVLENDVIPGMIETSAADNPPVRIWVPGCATGEEAYSLAMVFSEALQAADSSRELQIFATDIDAPALATARAGQYSEQAMENVSLDRRMRWFDRVEGGYRVTSDLRARVIFAVQSVIADPPFSRLDMISCRNVMIYLDKQTQRQVIALFHFALHSQGHLFLGSSENIDRNSPLFSARRHGIQIYRALPHSNGDRFRLGWAKSDPNPVTRMSQLSVEPQRDNARSLSEQVPRLLLDVFAPPSVITNARFQLLYVHGDLGPYLGFPTGTPSDDLLRIARRGMQTCLRRVIHSALDSQTRVVERARVLVEDGSYRAFEIHGRRFVPGPNTAACVLISFHTLADDMPRPARSAEQSADADDYVVHMEHELDATRDENQRLDDELQATRQEFKTTHEEALAINEELQSSNEELESSKEELQSLNEELSTVNDELKQKMSALREVTTDIENLLDSTDIPTIFLDAEHRINRFTPAARRLFKLIEGDVGQPLSDISHVFAEPLHIERIAAEVKLRREPIESEVNTRDDQWFLRRITPYRSDDENITGAVLSFLDVTPLKQAERAAAASQARFRAIYHDNPAMYFILDQAGVITSVNDFGAGQMGYEYGEMIGRAFEGLHADPTDLREQLDICRTRAGEIVRWELQLRTKSGAMIWIRANARLIEAPVENPCQDLGQDERQSVAIFISCENITQERKLAEEAHFHATHDALTGLLNRREFERLLALAIDSARSQDRSHTLAYLDLDNFKIINDTHGHEAGDEMLRQITQRMRESLQERDLLARIGGDEFALLMEDRDTDQARALAGKVVETICSTDFLWKRQRLRVNTCIGLAPIHPGVGDVATVMRAADAACFAAKELGPGSVHEHGEEDLRVNRRREEMSWADQLHAALAEDRIELHAQPIVNLAEPDGPYGYECLLRLRMHSGEIILPGRFMNAANRYGLIRDLDRRALTLLLAYLGNAGSALKPMRWIAINLSATSLIHPDFLSMVTTALDQSGVDASLICFEITETPVISNLSQAKHFIHELQKRGCIFALDDFGTGLSSFDYLRELPVEYVKIDGSFIRDMIDDEPDRAMVEAIVEITRMMGKRTIAECVETAALLSAVESVDIDYAQGYHFARPAPLDDVLLAR